MIYLGDKWTARAKNPVSPPVGSWSACRRTADSALVKLPSPPVRLLARDPHWGIFSLVNPMRNNEKTVASGETSQPPLIFSQFQRTAKSGPFDFLD